MSRISDLLDQLHRVQSGDPWYGDSIAGVLQDITAKEAAARPVPDAHTIWELVLHMTAWVREVRRRLVEGVWRTPEDGDWPAVPDPSPGNWDRARAALSLAHDQLRAGLQDFPAGRLDDQLGGLRDRAMGSGQSYIQMLHGIVQHDVYHLGQVGLLKKAVRR
jgi:uncharacterized damage-inducible protein DinB